MTKLKSFLKRKNVNLSLKFYFVDTMSSMAQGLFASLLIGTIFGALGDFTSLSIFTEMEGWAQGATGAALGVSIAFALKAPPLVMFSAAAVGMVGNSLASLHILGGVEKSITAGPAGAFFATIVAVELGKIVSKETKVDILVTPIVTILSGTLVAKLVCPVIAYLMYQIGYFINTATELQPFIMGIIISVVVGIILTLPISSAAICAMIGISGIAGGAAMAGCAAQMVGFAVISFRENRFGGIVAQGLGTSMLQMGNIVKNPWIWLPPTLASAFTGPLSTMVFKLQCNGVAAGMGTCGLVGPLGAIQATEEKGLFFWFGLLMVTIILPALLSLVFSEITRRLGLIRENDLKLDL